MPRTLTEGLAGTLPPRFGFHIWSNVPVNEALSVLISDPISSKKKLKLLITL